jgi:hypothetical protein
MGAGLKLPARRHGHLEDSCLTCTRDGSSMIGETEAADREDLHPAARFRNFLRFSFWVDRGCVGSGLRTIERLPRLLRKLGQQVRPVPSDNAAYAIVYNIDAVEGLNLTADDFKVVSTEAVTVQKFHWHGRPIRESVESFPK